MEDSKDFEATELAKCGFFTLEGNAVIVKEILPRDKAYQ